MNMSVLEVTMRDGNEKFSNPSLIVAEVLEVTMRDGNSRCCNNSKSSLTSFSFRSDYEG